MVIIVILWHHQETRRQTEKTNINLYIGRTGLLDSNYLHEGNGVQDAAVLIIFQEDYEDSGAILQLARPYIITLAVKVKVKVVAEKK